MATTTEDPAAIAAAGADAGADDAAAAEKGKRRSRQLRFDGLDVNETKVSIAGLTFTISEAAARELRLFGTVRLECDCHVVKRTHHGVRDEWGDNGVEQQIVLKMDTARRVDAAGDAAFDTTAASADPKPAEPDPED